MTMMYHRGETYYQAYIGHYAPLVRVCKTTIPPAAGPEEPRDGWSITVDASYLPPNWSIAS